MSAETPPPLPPVPRRWGLKIGLAAAGLGAFLFLSLVVFVVLRATGLIGIYHIPTASMAPAINRGDDIFVEDFTYRRRPPARGEIIVFQGDGLSGMRTQPGEKYVKRLVGLPGDRLRIADGVLYVNDQPAILRNKAGEIRYTTTVGAHLRREDETFTVPAGGYFVLGDNSSNSADSRLYGVVPVQAVVGRVVFCYWPNADAGWTR